MINSDVRINQARFIDFHNQYFAFGEPPKQTHAIRAGIDEDSNPWTPFYTNLKVEQTEFIRNRYSITTTGKYKLEVVDNAVNSDINNYVFYGGIDNSVFITSVNNQDTPPDLAVPIIVKRNNIYNVTGAAFFQKVHNLDFSENFIDLETQTSTFYSSKNNNESYGLLINNLNENMSIASPILIDDNTIQHARNGIIAEFTRATITNNKIYDLNDAYLENPGCNYPYFGPPCYNMPTIGIKASGTDVGYTIEQNEVSLDLTNYSSNPQTNDDVVGILIENITNMFLNFSTAYCNKVENTGIGLKASGSNDILLLYGNTMKGHEIGFVLANNGYIGNIGYSGTASDNEWKGSFSGSHTFSDNSNGAATTFYVQNSGNFNPVINSWDATPLFTPLSKDDSGNNPITLSCSAPQLVGQSIKNKNPQHALKSGRTSWGQQIRSGLPNYMVHAPDSALAFNRQLLFGQLSRDTSVRKTALWKPYLDSLAASTLSNFFADSTSTLARSYTQSNFEMNLIAIHPIKRKMQQGESLTTSDSLKLLQLAKLCPFYDGIAVYEARNLLQQIGIPVVVSACELTVNSRLNTQSQSSLKSNNNNGIQSLAGLDESFAIYPNPANHQVKLDFEHEGDEQVLFELYDVIGKLHFQKELKAGNVHQFNVAQLNTGLYFYRLVKQDAIIQSGKLMKN